MSHITFEIVEVLHPYNKIQYRIDIYAGFNQTELKQLVYLFCVCFCLSVCMSVAVTGQQGRRGLTAVHPNGVARNVNFGSPAFSLPLLFLPSPHSPHFSSFIFPFRSDPERLEERCELPRRGSWAEPQPK